MNYVSVQRWLLFWVFGLACFALRANAVPLNKTNATSDGPSNKDDASTYVIDVAQTSDRHKFVFKLSELKWNISKHNTRPYKTHSLYVVKDDKTSTMNLAILPGLAILIFFVAMCLRCCTWFRQDIKEREYGKEHDDFFIIMEPDEDYNEVEFRSDTSTIVSTNYYDTVSSYCSLSRRKDMADNYNDTVTSFRSFLMRRDTRDAEIQATMSDVSVNTSPMTKMKQRMNRKDWLNAESITVQEIDPSDRSGKPIRKKKNFVVCAARENGDENGDKQARKVERIVTFGEVYTDVGPSAKRISVEIDKLCSKISPMSPLVESGLSGVDLMSLGYVQRDNNTGTANRYLSGAAKTLENGKQPMTGNTKTTSKTNNGGLSSPNNNNNDGKLQSGNGSLVAENVVTGTFKPSSPSSDKEMTLPPNKEYLHASMNGQAPLHTEDECGSDVKERNVSPSGSCDSISVSSVKDSLDSLSSNADESSELTESSKESNNESSNSPTQKQRLVNKSTQVHTAGWAKRQAFRIGKLNRSAIRTSSSGDSDDEKQRFDARSKSVQLRNNRNNNIKTVDQGTDGHIAVMGDNQNVSDAVPQETASLMKTVETVDSSVNSKSADNLSNT